MTRIIVILIFIITALFSSNSAVAREIFVQKTLSISNESSNPVTIEVTSLQSNPERVISLHPYSVDMTGVKNELQIYRKMYITVAIIIMTGLVYAAKAKYL
jgi:hypothetical protein